jgi:hypothetical protein
VIIREARTAVPHLVNISASVAGLFVTRRRRQVFPGEVLASVRWLEACPSGFSLEKLQQSGGPQSSLTCQE